MDRIPEGRVSARPVQRATPGLPGDLPGRRFSRHPQNDRPIGRLYLARWEQEIRIIDIALLPEYRNAGIGSTILNDLLGEATRGGKRVSIRSEQAVEETLLAPDKVRRSRSDPDVLLFYRAVTPGRWMCAVAKRLDSEGFLVTAYPTDTIKEGERTLLPAYRDGGIGSAIFEEILADARAYREAGHHSRGDVQSKLSTAALRTVGISPAGRARRLLLDGVVSGIPRLRSRS